jgi:type III pantothenate kinase
MWLTIDVGNSRVKGAFFEGDDLIGTFVGDVRKAVQGKKLEKTILCSTNQSKAEEVAKILGEEKIEFLRLKISDFEKMLDVEEKNEVGADRIANLYGALHHFPVNDCVVVDAGTAVTFDYVTKDGKYLGGAIYPGMDVCAKGLHEYTSALPYVKVEKPESVLGKTTKAHIQVGIYYGLLGAIERVVAELRLTSPSPSSVAVIATGGLTENKTFNEDVLDFVDRIDPHLTLVGLKEILKERR